MFEDADRKKMVTVTAGRPLTEGNLLIITKCSHLGLHTALLALEMLSSHFHSGLCVHL